MAVIVDSFYLLKGKKEENRCENYRKQENMFHLRC